MSVSTNNWYDNRNNCCAGTTDKTCCPANSIQYIAMYRKVWIAHLPVLPYVVHSFTDSFLPMFFYLVEQCPSDVDSQTHRNNLRSCVGRCCRRRSMILQNVVNCKPKPRHHKNYYATNSWAFGSELILLNTIIIIIAFIVWWLYDPKTGACVDHQCSSSHSCQYVIQIKNAILR